MSLVNTTVKPFEATAFVNGSFVPVSSADIERKWAIFFFYPADFTFVCPTELGDLADHYERTRNHDRALRNAIHRLNALGYRVTLQAA